MAQDLLTASSRLAGAIQNALEIRRFGKLGNNPRTPYDVVVKERVFSLRHYRSKARRGAKQPAVILVPPLMLSADVYDITAEGSAVAALMKGGIDPWVVDFGAPEKQEGGTRRTLADHVVAVSHAVDRVRKKVGHDVHLGGYSQGGMFCYQTAAFRQSEGLASVITFGSPVDVRREMIPGIPDEVAGRLLDIMGPIFARSFSTTAVPAWLSRTAFKLMSPAKELQSQIEFLTRLHDREAIKQKEGQRNFLASEGWVAWPGPALRDFVEQFLMQNRMVSGGFVVDGRPTTLADITCPIVTFVGTTDEIARPGPVRAIHDAAPHAEIFEVSLEAGHFGLVVGSKAMKHTWPTVADWARWRDGKGTRPEGLLDAAEALAQVHIDENDTQLASLAVEIGKESFDLLGSAFSDAGRTASGFVGNVLRQLPRTARLAGVNRNTRIGFSLALSEQAESNPDDTFFLYDGRAYSYAVADRRVDAVVRGLLSIGVRQSDHVGIFMHNRPSALAMAAATSRIGAVAVLLRPDGDLAQEIDLSDIGHLVTDPENSERARDTFAGTVYVLGGVGGGATRTLPDGVVDMEKIDPDAIKPPDWYSPSPGRAEDVAFLLFSGDGEKSRLNRINNRRWALSALGTASASALGSSDTVYCGAPIQHATGLLVSMSGALVGGARLAFAKPFAADTFWEEARRYGTTVSVYAGSMCRELVDAAVEHGESNHPIRLFAGSGMPPAIWRRIQERFGPVSVLEFYASTEGNAILANLSGEKVGSVGRPLPGSAEVAIAAYDYHNQSLVQEPSGYCRAVADGHCGVLLARVERERGAVEGKPLRSVFERGDAWYMTSDLFLRDDDGDYWLVDHLSDVIHHKSGFLPSMPIEQAVWEIDEISAAAAYGMDLGEGCGEIPAVAIMLRGDEEVDLESLRDWLDRDLEHASKPILLHVVDDIPVTAGYRFRKSPLRAAGVPKGKRFLWRKKSGDYEWVNRRKVQENLKKLAGESR